MTLLEAVAGELRGRGTRGFLASIFGAVGVWKEQRRKQQTIRKLRESVPAGSEVFRESVLAEIPVVPQTERAVPIPVAALTELLDKHPMARATLKHLVIVEQTLKLAKYEPFSYIPPSMLQRALRQLEGLGALTGSGDLQLLHLQMRRRVMENEVRAQATVQRREAKWMPEPDSRSTGRFPVLGDVVDARPTVPDLLSEVFDSASDERYQGLDFEDTQPMGEPISYRRRDGRHDASQATC